MQLQLKGLWRSNRHRGLELELHARLGAGLKGCERERDARKADRDGWTMDLRHWGKPAQVQRKAENKTG